MFFMDVADSGYMQRKNPNPWTLLLTDGGMRSLVATATYAQQTRLQSLYIHDGRTIDDLSIDAVRQQAAHYKVQKISELLMPHLMKQTVKSSDGSEGGTHPLRWQQLILAACSVAMQSKADQIIWPVQALEAKLSAKITENILLLQEMVQIEMGSDIAIETPFIDVTDKQLVELGHQLEVPWEIARSCQYQSTDPCGSCLGCAQRRQAFRSAGMHDPQTEVTQEVKVH